MRIYQDISIADFEPWSGAVSTFEYLTNDDCETLEYELESLYPDGMTETELNDILWFECDFIAQCLGYYDWEEFAKDRARRL